MLTNISTYLFLGEYKCLSRIKDICTSIFLFRIVAVYQNAVEKKGQKGEKEAQ